MKKYLLALLTLVSSAVCAQAQISGSLKFLSPTTKTEISKVRIGKSVLVKLSVKDLHLLADKNVTLTYALSATPKGSNTPIQVSGKLSSRLVLPESEGGLAATKRELSGMKGLHTMSELIQIPDFMPVGVATLTINLSTPSAGSISFNKSLTVTL
jgi:hypothetical protein